MTKFIVDRIENGFAVLERENLSHENVPLADLPSGTKEGSVLLFDNGAYFLDSYSETEIRKRIIEKQRSIFKKKN